MKVRLGVDEIEPVSYLLVVTLLWIAANIICAILLIRLSLGCMAALFNLPAKWLARRWQ